MSELILQVTGAQVEDLEKSGTSSQFTFSEFGGTIGRASGGGTHWVLPDGMVSGMHAAISYVGGGFHIEDRNSRNGVFLNSTRIPVGRPHALRDGDTVRIDPYTIRVSVSARPRPAVPQGEHPAPTGGQILEQFSGVWPPDSRDRPPSHDTPADHDYVATPDPIAAPPEPAPPGSPRAPRGYNPAESIYAKAVPEEPAAPTPRPVSPRPPASDAPVAPQPAQRGLPTERSQKASAAGTPATPRRDTTLADVFAAAGIPDVPITPDLARELGTMLRIAAQGLVDVLRTRQDVKKEFDVERTIPGLVKNNPLKLARDGNEALRVLFAQRHPSFLDPVEAFRDSFDDLRKHHVAMSKGIQAAFNAMLGEFDPDRLEERFSRRAMGAIVPLPAKIRAWELYRERFDDLVRGDPDDVFRRLFGDAFSEAYSAQLKDLKAPPGDDV